MCTLIVLLKMGTFLNHSLLLSLADRKNKLMSRVVSALILELESRFHYYCRLVS